MWDQSDDARVDAYEVEWRRAEEEDWRRTAVAPGRRHRIDGLEDGVAYAVRMRAVGAGVESAWTPIVRATVGLYRYCARVLLPEDELATVPKLVIAHDVRHDLADDGRGSNDLKLIGPGVRAATTRRRCQDQGKAGS